MLFDSAVAILNSMNHKWKVKKIMKTSITKNPHLMSHFGFDWILMEINSRKFEIFCWFYAKCKRDRKKYDNEIDFSCICVLKFE